MIGFYLSIYFLVQLLKTKVENAMSRLPLTMKEKAVYCTFVQCGDLL